MIKARDRHDRIIVTEKLDGSNVAVAKVGGSIIALSRAGYLANTSPYEQHHLFAHWVEENEDRFKQILCEGHRLNGEWLALAHGTKYDLLHEPFVAFDLMYADQRFAWDRTAELCRSVGIVTPRILHDGGPIHIEQVLPLLDESGHGALDPVEGAVWRVERQGKFDFIAKWVRPDKVDGKYLTDISGHPEIWHWRPSKVAA